MQEKGLDLIEALSHEILAFIREHENDDVAQLILKHELIHGVPSAIVADQIRGRQKAKGKLPTFYSVDRIFYPPGLNIEQSSSEKTAKYKADMIRELLSEGQRNLGIDLSGGFGVDTYFLSRVFQAFKYIEPNRSLLEIAKHNHQQLNAASITYHNSTAEHFIEALEHADLIYIDPSRRVKTQKVFSLKDCEPDITTLQNQIFQKFGFLLIKASPLLDLQIGLKEIRFVKTVIVLAVDNECKEILFFCDKRFNDEPLIKAVNLTGSSEDSFVFKASEEKRSHSDIGELGAFIYEPNAAILKAGAFKLIGANFNLKKLHPSTHLYTSSEQLKMFPGRVFKVIDKVKPDTKALQQFFPDGKANIFVRNYPLSVEELKKKTKLKDGGDNYLIGCSTDKEKLLIAATRLK
ncbi:THUMP-like domain-containing protein [Chryseosolibacter indicus]|uniref:SAM-dependent methyltransferase n=1 Tax=Chryseosolibacter indicus TaxID=2782351 RepID=A0ABS5VYA6_9BACT|nr:SAM-dependent methyltransferase [Chryseosolibacter indicus]MBT1706380.1 SAM-dependent methyltransferase [Chryseosolibacter indicus]